MFMVPPIRTPFSDFLNTLDSVQDHPVCAPFELRMANCLDAYGLDRGIDKCNLYIHDLYECMAQTKRIWRYEQMHKERAHVYARTGKERPYMTLPRGDFF